MVSARTIMIGLVLFYLGDLVLANRGALTDRARAGMTARMLAVGLVGLPIACFAAVLFLDTTKLVGKITNDLAIFDPDRGVLSGFTGRSETWNVFFDTIDRFVLFGYGFRSSRYGLNMVHSGVLSYFMDFGLILGGALLVAVVARAGHLILCGVRTRDRRALLCGLAIATTLLIQWFEPDNFNLGFIGSFFFILILAFVAPDRGLAVAAWRPWDRRCRAPLQVRGSLSGRSRFG